MSRGTGIVDAAVTAINAGSYTLSFTATKQLFPFRDLSGLSSIIVRVFQGNIGSDRVSRTNTYIETYDIMVAVAAPLADEDNATLEPYFDTVEELQDLLRLSVLTSGSIDYHCQEVDVVSPFGEDMMTSNGVYSNILTFKFKG